MIAIKRIYTRTRHTMNFVPFIDVVFMLLIYFFVAAEIRPTEADFTTNLPGYGRGVNPPKPEDLKEVYHVYLRVVDPADGRVEVSINNTVLGEGPEAFRTLEARLESIPDKAHMAIEINGDSNVTVQSIANTLDAAMGAEVPSVRFARHGLGS